MNSVVRTLPIPPADVAWAWALERPASDPLVVHVLPALAAGPKPPREDELFLWFGAPGADGCMGLLGYLGEEELERAASFRFDTDRWAYAAAHAGLRILLGRMTGCAPHALRFAVGAKGKPRLAGIHEGSAIEFSLSHTRGCVAVALAGRAVGIDVERPRTLPDLSSIARIAFAPASQAALAASAGPDARLALFHRFWTLGEAFIKATGEGLAQDLASFAFTDRGSPALTQVSADWGPSTRWRFDCGP